jgi:hypothetical protein
VLSPALRRPPAAVALALTVCFATSSAGCGGGDDPDRRRQDTRSLGSATVDASAGTYRGAGIGSNRIEAERVLGPSRGGPGAPLEPLGEEGLAVGVPPALEEPPGLDGLTAWRFRDAAMLADRGRAWLVVVSLGDARTKEGVGVGSSLDDVRDTYESPQCAVANEGTEYVRFPYCQVRVRPGRYVWFAYDPIRSVAMSRAPMACPDEGARVTGCPPT